MPAREKGARGEEGTLGAEARTPYPDSADFGASNSLHLGTPIFYAPSHPPLRAQASNRLPQRDRLSPRVSPRGLSFPSRGFFGFEKDCPAPLLHPRRWTPPSSGPPDGHGLCGGTRLNQSRGAGRAVSAPALWRTRAPRMGRVWPERLPSPIPTQDSPWGRTPTQPAPPRSRRLALGTTVAARAHKMGRLEHQRPWGWGGSETASGRRLRSSRASAPAVPRALGQEIRAHGGGRLGPGRGSPSKTP